MPPTRELAVQRHVHRDGSVLYSRVDPDDVSRDDAVARVDRRRLTDLDVAAGPDVGADRSGDRLGGRAGHVLRLTSLLYGVTPADP